METLIILVKLLCAHLCSDFILQTDRINSGKRKPGLKGISYLILHSITHACIAYMKCNFVTYQIPAVVSSKAQKAIENSYISDIYAIFNPDNNWTPSKSLTDVSNALIKCAKFREGKISYSLAQRALIMAWLEFNVSADLLNDSDAIIDSVFDKNGNELVLKERQIDQDKPTFYKEARKIAEKTLSMGPCEWSLIYEKIASETAEYGIPDPHEVKNALEGYVTFDGSRCMAFVQENKQLLFDF